MYSYRRFLVFGLNLGDSDSKKVDTAAWWWVKSFRDRGRHVSMIKSKTTSFFGAGWSEFTYLSPDSVTTVRTLWMSPWLCWKVSWQCRCQHLQLKLSCNESINVKINVTDSLARACKFKWGSFLRDGVAVVSAKISEAACHYTPVAPATNLESPGCGHHGVPLPKPLHASCRGAVISSNFRLGFHVSWPAFSISLMIPKWRTGYLWGFHVPKMSRWKSAVWVDEIKKF